MQQKNTVRMYPHVVSYWWRLQRRQIKHFTFLHLQSDILSQGHSWHGISSSEHWGNNREGRSQWSSLSGSCSWRDGRKAAKGWIGTFLAKDAEEDPLSDDCLEEGKIGLGYELYDTIWVKSFTRELISGYLYILSSGKCTDKGKMGGTHRRVCTTKIHTTLLVQKSLPFVYSSTLSCTSF